MPPRTPHDDMPPSYQDALVHGIYTRSGKTPFPEAPRLNARCLELSGSMNLEFQKLKDASLSKPPVPRQQSKPPPEVRKAVPKSAPSGWQSDASYMSTSTASATHLKKKKLSISSGSSTLNSLDVAECRVIPMLAYHPRKPLLLLDFSKPLSRMKIRGDVPIRVRDSELDQHATSPPRTSMIIMISDFSGSEVHVRNRSGVTNRDILSKIQQFLYAGLSRQDWDSVKGSMRERVKLAFYNRCRSSDLLEEVERRNGLKRVDLLCESVLWKGLAPDPANTNAWILTLGRSD